jgi:hypothetical protein
MKVARYEVPGIGKEYGPVPEGTVEIGLRGKLCVPNFTPVPNQASLRDKKPTQLLRSSAKLAFMGFSPGLLLSDHLMVNKLTGNIVHSRV